MTHRVTVSQPAPPGARFTEDAFTGQIGKRLPFRVEGRTVADCTVVAAVVAPDGSSADITLDIPHQETTMPERVPVRCILVIGDQAEIAADAPDATTPERYPAADVAQQAGVHIEDLPGLGLTAQIGAGDRLRDFRTQ